MIFGKNIRVVVVKDAAAGGERAFLEIERALKSGELQTLGLATGSTPETLYDEMRASDLDFSDVVGVNLDEYIGLAADHPQSYAHFMQEKLYGAKPFKETFIPDGLAEASSEIARYDQVLADHPIDLQLLGIGTNAHIGFNEPGSSFDGRTQAVQLAPATIEANQRFFESAADVPQSAYSMGLASIMEAKKIMLLAYGENKAEAIYDTLCGSVTEDVPASILQRHDDVLFILDKEAAAKLPLE